MSLEIQYITLENALEIKPIGEVDIYTSPELKNKIFELIEEKRSFIAPSYWGNEWCCSEREDLWNLWQ